VICNYKAGHQKIRREYLRSCFETEYQQMCNWKLWLHYMHMHYHRFWLKLLKVCCYMVTNIALQ